MLRTNLTKHQLDLIRTAASSVRKLKRVMDDLDVYPTGVASSFVPFTILTKAFNVHSAVVSLCKVGLPSEAFALSRVLVEMYIGLRWMTNQDQNKRCEEFVQFVAARKQRLANVRKTYYPNDPKTPQYVKWVERVFGKHGAKYKDLNFWASVDKKLWGMASEKEILYNAPLPYPNLQFEYKSFFSMTSDHVHATMEALGPLIPEIGCPYKVVSANPAAFGQLTERALIVATCWFMYIIARVDEWRDLGIREEIKAASLPFEKLAGLRRATSP